MPSTSVVFSICLASTTYDFQNISHALYTIPVGMFVDVIYILLWRELPQTIEEQVIDY